METTRINPVGSAMQRDELARQGGGRLFHLRRERDLARGLLSARGHGNDYLVFQPSIYFSRVLGDRVLRLNAALSEVREQGAELMPSVGVDRLHAHYGELEQLIEAARDRLAALIRYCHKGSAGRFEEALEGFESGPGIGGPEPSDEPGAGEAGPTPVTGTSDTGTGAAAAGTAAGFFDALRQRHFEQGILTEFGRDQACVAFQPSQFFGRFLGEIAYSLNDALRRLEGNTAYYVLCGDGDWQQRYYLRLEGDLAKLGADLDGVISYCRREVA